MECAAIVNAQDINTYLFKRDPDSDYGYISNTKLLGKMVERRMSEISLYPNQDRYDPVCVYIDLINVKKSQTSLGDTTGTVYNRYDNRIGFGLLKQGSGGTKFILPPVFSEYHVVRIGDSFDENYLFGQKLKNGNWKCVTVLNKDMNKINQFPEMKDYTILGQDLILFKDLNGKYGLMNYTGNILAEAKYDTCITHFSYSYYGENENLVKEEKPSIANRSNFLNKPFYDCESFERSFMDNKDSRDLYFPIEMKEEMVFLLKSGESSILASSNYITKEVKNARVFNFYNASLNFYQLIGDGNDHDIILLNGFKPDEKYKYAYIETARRDTTNGIFSNWGMDDQTDYSKPFNTSNLDSIELARKEEQRIYLAKVRKEEELKRLKDEELERKKIELEKKNTNSLTSPLEGSYSFSSFADGSMSMAPNFSIFTISADATSRVNLYISVQNNDYRMNTEYKFNAEMTLEVTKSGNTLYLSKPNDIIQDNIQSVSGAYNESTRELNLKFSYYTPAGTNGFINLKAYKKD